MISLGLDISTTSTGWAVLETARLVDYGTFGFRPKVGLSNNLVLFESYLTALKTTFPVIDKICIEDTYVGMNVKTTQILTRYSGAAILACRKLFPEAKIYVLMSASIRSALWPGRKFDKTQVYEYICSQYQLTGVPNDVTDAIAAASSVLQDHKDVSKWEI